MSNSSVTGLILLAAGASRRLGQPKQLLEYQNKSLLQHTIDCTDSVHFDPCLLVLGSKAKMIAEKTNYGNFRLEINPEWEEGIASSIRYGLSRLIALSPKMENILFLLSDQPHLSSNFLSRLLTEHEKTRLGITASTYAGEIGVPVIFHKKYFEELLSLKGDQGAKKIVMKYREEIQLVPFEGGEMDIDTMDDYDRLVKRH